MKVLITRPFHESLRVQKEISLMGIASDILPLFEIVRCSHPDVQDHTHPFVLTSQHAVESLKDYPHKNVPIYTVGSRTALMVEKYGFQDVRNADGNVDDLIKLLAHDKFPHVTYLSGERVSKNLSKALTPHGISCERVVVYRTQDRQSPILLSPQITHVMFFSTQAAKIFVNLLKDNVQSLHAICISPGVKEAVSMLNWGSIWVGPRPTYQGIMGYFNDRTDKKNSA